MKKSKIDSKALARAFDAGVNAKTHAYAMPTAEGREEYMKKARRRAIADRSPTI